MVVFISTFILIYVIQTVLVAISFFALRERFQWQISRRTSLIILFLIFAFLENYTLPMVLVLDITYTVGNSDIANLLNLRPDEPVAELFGIGLFEVVVWVVQSLLAALFGEAFVPKKRGLTCEIEE